MNISFMIASEDIPTNAKVTGLHGKLEDNFREVKVAGFDSVELMIYNPKKVQIDKIKSLARNYNLKIAFICSGEMGGLMKLALNHIDRHKRKEAIEAFKDAIHIANELKVNINIGRVRGKIWEDGKTASLDRLADSLKEIDEYILKEAPNVSVLIEPLRPDVCDILNNCETSKDFIEASKLRNFRLMLDSDHMDWESDPLFIKKHMDWVKHIHLADTLHKPLGNGHIDFNHFFSLLENSKYDGGYSVEIFCGEDQIKTLRDSAKFLKKFKF